MTIDLYYMQRSAPCRAIQMLAKSLGIELNLIEVDLVNGEHLKPGFLKMNPQHCVPTMNDNGFILWESRAILAYLVNKYGKDDSYYPKDPVKRARVDQKLYFDMGTLYARFKDYLYEQIFQKLPADPEKYKKLEEAMGFFDVSLEGLKYVTGDKLTIADFSLIASVSNLEVAGFPIDNYANVKRWYGTCKATAPGWDINLAAMEAYRPFIEQIKK